MTLGERIRGLREEKGMKVSELAEYVGVSQPFMTYVEQGKKSVSAIYLLRIADALGCSMDYLMKGE